MNIVLKLKEMKWQEVNFLLDHYLAMSPGMMMIRLKELIRLNHHLDYRQNGLQKTVKEDAEMLGYTVVDPP